MISAYKELIYKEHFTMPKMGCEERGNSMAIMLDHRSTVLGRDYNSQVLKHREFGIMFRAQFE